MQPERRPPDDPAEWLNRARGNLLRAEADIRLKGIYLEDLCFDVHQAAEKAIKAVLIDRRVRFPYVHDLGQLLAALEERGEVVPDGVKQAARLTRFAVETRYPGVGGPVTRQEYEDAIEIARAVLAWAEGIVEHR